MFSLSRFSTMGLVTSCLVALCGASPLHNVASNLRRAPSQEVEFNGKNIEVLPVSFQGVNSRAYQVVGGYGPAKVPAILKFVNAADRFQGEVENARDFDQLLDNDGKTGIILKDIHIDYPRKGDRKKQLHEWIAEDHPEWLKELDSKIRTAKKTIMAAVDTIAETKDKVLMDLSDNAFLSEDLSEASFCDLDPRYIKDLKGKEPKNLHKEGAIENAEENLNIRYTEERIKLKAERLQNMQKQ